MWKRSSANGLLKLAKEIESQGSWHGYLTVAEHEIFKNVVSQGGDQWARFLDGKVAGKVEVIPPSGGSHANGGSQQGSVGSPRRTTPALAGATPLETSTPRTPSASMAHGGTPQPTVTDVDSLTVCFRVRYMLYEKAIGVLFPSASAAQEIDFALLEDDDETDKQANKSKPAVRSTDDNYDDDYDDEEEEEEEEEEVGEKEKEKDQEKDMDATSQTDELTFKGNAYKHC